MFSIKNYNMNNLQIKGQSEKQKMLRASKTMNTVLLLDLKEVFVLLISSDVQCYINRVCQHTAEGNTLHDTEG